ncbi:acetyltransferase [Fusobacterium varium]|uniref:acetyltransferase n=1 Tax=Fusobacterium varium TaxID=856 RepID=UPI00242B2969|nr:acetyltransferase [Fusobacterium varium]MCF0170145.1 acetyltransferase [Fusobacterium varium]
MKDVVIIGAGGFAREVAWLIEEINKKNEQWNILGFIDDNSENVGKSLNGYKIIGNTDYLNEMNKNIYAVIAIGNGKTRKKIVEKLKKRKFGILIHPNVSISDTISIGEGSIICSGNILTVNISIGKHVIINLDCTIGHDAVIKNFSTFLPGTNLSGETIVEECSTLGTGSTVIQGIKIGKNVMVGAGAVVIRDIIDDSTAVGNPARTIK